MSCPEPTALAIRFTHISLMSLDRKPKEIADILLVSPHDLGWAWQTGSCSLPKLSGAALDFDELSRVAAVVAELGIGLI